MPVAGFLGNAAAIGQDVRLALNLVAHCGLNGAQRVYVLGLGSGAELFLTLGTERNVGIAAHVATLHLGVRDIHRLDHVTDHADILSGKLRGLSTEVVDRLGDNLHQWHTSTVVVNQGVFRSLNTTGGTTNVSELAGILFHVGALD